MNIFKNSISFKFQTMKLSYKLYINEISHKSKLKSKHLDISQSLCSTLRLTNCLTESTN